MGVPGTWAARIGLAISVGLAAIYSALWSAIAFAMERSFSLHIWDVGANYVLTSGTAPPGLDYGHLTWAPQNLIYVFFAPLVRVYPNPMTLVYAEDVLMGASGVFIYLVAVEIWRRRSWALLFEGLYLFNYALFGAPFYPNHYEILFSVFFPIAYLAYRKGHPAAGGVFLVLAALTSSLGAVMAGAFIALLLGPRFLNELRGRGLGIRRFFATHWLTVAAGVATVAVFAFPFVAVGPAITLSYAHLSGGPTSPNLAGGLLDNPVGKLTYIGLIAVPFVPALARTRYTLVMAPYALLVLVAGSSHYVQFWYQYTFMIGAPLFIAYFEGLRPHFGRARWPRTPVPSRRRAGRWRLPGSNVPYSDLGRATAIIVGLGFLALPYSPGNEWAGTYFTLPFHAYGLGPMLVTTPYNRAVWAMAQSIPLNASVLIQEDMPMLTNRAVWYEPGSYDGEPVDYALANPAVPWFDFSPPLFIGPYTVPMVDWVNTLHENRSYGILEEYQGAILFEKGYAGAPRLFVPYTSWEPGVAFVGPNATYTYVSPGLVSVSNEKNSSPSLRVEGLMALAPGAYSVTFALRASNYFASNRVSVGLWTKGNASVPLAVHDVSGSDLSPQGNWTDISFSFYLPGYADYAYFAMYGDTWIGTLTLGQVYLNQTAPG